MGVGLKENPKEAYHCGAPPTQYRTHQELVKLLAGYLRPAQVRVGMGLTSGTYGSWLSPWFWLLSHCSRDSKRGRS